VSLSLIGNWLRYMEVAGSIIHIVYGNCLIARPTQCVGSCSISVGFVYLRSVKYAQKAGRICPIPMVVRMGGNGVKMQGGRLWAHRTATAAISMIALRTCRPWGDILIATISGVGGVTIESAWIGARPIDTNDFKRMVVIGKCQNACAKLAG